MASIKVKYVGNEDGQVVVEYGGNLYYCDISAFGNQRLIKGQWYSVDHRELFARR